MLADLFYYEFKLFFYVPHVWAHRKIAIIWGLGLVRFILKFSIVDCSSSPPVDEAKCRYHMYLVLFSIQFVSDFIVS